MNEISEVFGVYEIVKTVIEQALERLKKARARLLDIISKNNVDSLGEVLGDINKAINDLEELL
jgi:mevalonate kinase